MSPAAALQASDEVAPDPAFVPGLLSQAKAAWRAKQYHEGELARMRRYRRATDGMKADQERHQERLADAHATLERILGSAA